MTQETEQKLAEAVSRMKGTIGGWWTVEDAEQENAVAYFHLSDVLRVLAALPEARDHIGDVTEMVRAAPSPDTGKMGVSDAAFALGALRAAKATLNGLGVTVGGRIGMVEEAIARLSAPVSVGDGEAFQARVLPWLMECFGAEIAADQVERTDRFIEEALELAQSLDCPVERAHALVDYVFGRPKGEPHQEVGGVMVTLAALCQAAGLDMQKGGDDELARIMRPEIVQKIRAKQAAKPTGSALSVDHPSDPSATDRMRAALEESADFLISHFGPAGGDTSDISTWSDDDAWSVAAQISAALGEA